jgi:hypothetical protein
MRKSHYIDLTGKKFGKLTVLQMYGRDKNNVIKWLCKCECGNETIVYGEVLKNGRTQSCGCSQTTHNMTKTRPYETWSTMKKRCYNPHCEKYSDYGGRGIIVCDKWLTFEGFWEDMQEGYSDDLTIDNSLRVIKARVLAKLCPASIAEYKLAVEAELCRVEMRRIVDEIEARKEKLKSEGKNPWDSLAIKALEARLDELNVYLYKNCALYYAESEFSFSGLPEAVEKEAKNLAARVEYRNVMRANDKSLPFNSEVEGKEGTALFLAAIATAVRNQRLTREDRKAFAMHFPQYPQNALADDRFVELAFKAAIGKIENGEIDELKDILKKYNTMKMQRIAANR